MSLLGALSGSLLALISGNKLGRRTELMMASVLYGVGATLLGVSPNLGVLLAARVLYGLGIGFAMHAGARVDELQCRGIRRLGVLSVAQQVGGKRAHVNAQLCTTSWLAMAGSDLLSAS